MSLEYSERELRTCEKNIYSKEQDLQNQRLHVEKKREKRDELEREMQKEEEKQRTIEADLISLTNKKHDLEEKIRKEKERLER